MKNLVLILSAVILLSSCGSDGEKMPDFGLDKITHVEAEENLQIASLAKGKEKLFIEDGRVYIDAPVHHLDKSSIDSTVYEIAGINFPYEGYQAVAIDFYTKLDITAGVHFYSGGKELKLPGTKNSMHISMFKTHPLIEKDAIVFGVLVLILVLIFYTHSIKTGFWPKFYKVIPALLLCYFVPAIFNSLNIFNGEFSELYSVSKNYFLPASLVLLCLSIDLKGVLNLGPKALIMFFTATFGIIIGGPIALSIVDSYADLSGGDAPDAAWRGLSTVAGSWIGGGANQMALKEIAKCPETLFSGMIVVDVFVANIWMAFLLFGAGITKSIDKKLKSDTTAIDALKNKAESFQASISKVPTFNDIMIIAAIAFTGVGLAHLLSGWIAPSLKASIDASKAGGSTIAKYLDSLGSGFFWLIILATIIGVIFSFTKLKKYEGAGASKFGSLFIYLLVATIGMKMDIPWLIENWSKFVHVLVIGLIWMAIHVIVLLGIAKLIKAPFFYVAVGSQANIGGAASAPIVASAFAPALAPVGVLLAVLGYAVGTIGAIFCMELMHAVSL